MYNPTWKQYEKDMHSGDAKKEFEAFEAFSNEREKELATSAKARKWEEERKKEAMAYKPTHVKKRIAAEKAEYNKPLKELKNAGIFSNLNPAPGFILVEVNQQEEQTSSGIILSVTPDTEPNTGTVLKCGPEKVYVNIEGLLEHMPCPIKQGDKILFKKFAGMDAVVDGNNCRLMQFTDVLGLIQ